MRYHLKTAQVMEQCVRTARSLGHSYVGSEHLLLALSREPGGVGMLLRLLGLDPDLTEAMAQLLYGAGAPDLPLPQGLTLDAREILRGAAREARMQDSREIRPEHLLIALARQEDSAAGELLLLNGITPQELFDHAVEHIRWEQTAPVRGKKGGVFYETIGAVQ